jgi:transposase-like protein
MSEAEAFRTCPHCASQEVPTYILHPTRVSGSAASWRCRVCGREWSDSQFRLLRAS